MVFRAESLASTCSYLESTSTREEDALSIRPMPSDPQLLRRLARQVSSPALLLEDSNGFRVDVSMKVKSVGKHFTYRQAHVPNVPRFERVVVSDAGRGDDVEFYRQHGDEPCPWARFFTDSWAWHSCVIRPVLLCSQAVCNGLRRG